MIQKPNYKIVRQIMKIRHHDAKICGDNEINKRIANLRQKAIKLAESIGILKENMDIDINYYPDYLPMFHPAVPTKIPKNFKECLASSCEPCVVSIVIIDKLEAENNYINKYGYDING